MEFLLGALGAIFIAGFCYYENNWISTTSYEVDLGLEEEIIVVHLSDLHSKQYGKNNKKLKKLILDEKPDLIVATGDIIDSNLENMGETINFLSDLNKDVKVIFILGNNEQRCEKADYIYETLKAKGVTALENEITTFTLRDIKINILGMLELPVGILNSPFKKVKGRYVCSYADSLFKKLENLEGVKIALSHYPEKFEEEYSKYDFDVMFSGHAHGGQFVIPVIRRGLIAPGQGFFPKYTEGMHGSKNKLIISRGLGSSGIPLRLFNRPEIVKVKIK